MQPRHVRAVYVGTNPAQAMRDPSTDEIRGPELGGASSPVLWGCNFPQCS
jgi:hypothetical protein